MTLYCDYTFEINESGLKLTNKAEPDEFHQVQIKNTPLNVGDTFTLELDEDNCMFFKKIGPVQLNLEI
jgi:hypothetical protein